MPLVILWVVDHKQVIELKQIIDPQQVHSWNQGLPLAKEKVHSHVLARIMIKQRESMARKITLLSRYWVRVRLHEGLQ